MDVTYTYKRQATGMTTVLYVHMCVIHDLLHFCLSLIEEFMLLANMAVAHKIWRAFPEKAMLRRHPPPKEKSAQFLVRQ